MEFEKVVLKRRMVRNFTDEPVSEADLTKILQLALHAPSAGFSQGWSYVVVRDADRRKLVGKVQGETEEYAVGGFANFISKSPIAIVACTSEQVYHRRYQEKDKILSDGTEIAWPTPYWHFDIGAACMLILLAAVNLGYSAVFTGVFDPKGMKELLSIPEEYHPVGVISIGKGAKDVKSPSLKRGRKALDQLVHSETWGRPHESKIPNV